MSAIMVVDRANTCCKLRYRVKIFDDLPLPSFEVNLAEIRVFFTNPERKNLNLERWEKKILLYQTFNSLRHLPARAWR